MSAARNAETFGDGQHSTGDGMDNGKRLFFANRRQGYNTIILKIRTPLFTLFAALSFFFFASAWEAAKTKRHDIMTAREESFFIHTFVIRDKHFILGFFPF